MPKTWRFLPFDPSHVRSLCQRLNVSPVLAQVLSARGFTDAERAAAFLDSKLTELHDPELLPGVSAAADRIVAALRDGRRITVYGDYDVDGVTATSLLWHCLKLAGGTVEYYIPHRMDEGYGIHEDALRSLHERDPKMLVVSVDCGITGIHEASVARQLGLELIITDHHEPAATLPEPDVLVHPRLPSTNPPYPFGELCGVGVAFKLAWAVCSRLGDGRKASPHMREFLLSAVGLTALGTVADVVPVLDENRVFVRYGLKSLCERPPLGLRELMNVCGLGESGPRSAEDIAFKLAPRINAAGRLGQARLAVELLTTENPERARKLAEYLEEQNRMRQTVERRILKQAKELIEQHPELGQREALVLAHHEWHPGVIGIVASRLVEQFEKPTVLLALNPAEGTGQGSGRTFGSFNLLAGLHACAEHLATFGGHHAAAGLSLSADRIDVFRDAFCEHVASNHTVSAHDVELRVDAEVRLADIDLRAVRELDRLGPFGRSNPSPRFASTRVQLAEAPRTMGEGGHHLSLRVKQQGTTMRAISFGHGDWADEIAKATGTISICYAPIVNRFRDRENVELQLHDWQPDK